MDALEIARIFFALIAVLGMIGLAAMIARRAGVAGNGAARRMAIVEALPLDGRRRAVILRCDDREHLLILGPAGETFIGQTMRADTEVGAHAAGQPSLAEALVALKARAANPFQRPSAKDAA